MVDMFDKNHETMFFLSFQLGREIFFLTKRTFNKRRRKNNFILSYMQLGVYFRPTLKETKKGVVLLRREISLKGICEKVKFSICVFAIVFMTINGHIYILLKRT